MIRVMSWWLPRVAFALFADWLRDRLDPQWKLRRAERRVMRNITDAFKAATPMFYQLGEAALQCAQSFNRLLEAWDEEGYNEWLESYREEGDG